MVARLILTIDDAVVREIMLTKERVTIGRAAHNDIVLDHLAVSAEHAMVVTIANDSYIEDQNSTNGTQINGQPVKKHYLQDGDVIELAQYRVLYQGDDCAGIEPQAAVTAFSERHAPASVHNHREQNKIAVIKVLNGSAAGKSIPLAKTLTTIGRPGEQIAVITHHADRYSITHVEGNTYPLVNGQALGAGAYFLVDGDIVELSGVRMEFSLA